MIIVTDKNWKDEFFARPKVEGIASIKMDLFPLSCRDIDVSEPFTPMKRNGQKSWELNLLGDAWSGRVGFIIDRIEGDRCRR